tara:strand:- start:599 stop:985 length:387 start_codon:yes stop_codon:yes gene_type:complete
MAQSYGILGQIYLGQSGSSNTNNVLSNVYSCPVGSNTIINSIYLCNQSATNGNVSVALYPHTLGTNPIGEVGNSHFVLKDQEIRQAESLILNLNLTMNAGTTLAVNNAVRTGETFSNVSISAFGVAIT